MNWKTQCRPQTAAELLVPSPRQSLGFGVPRSAQTGLYSTHAWTRLTPTASWRKSRTNFLPSNVHVLFGSTTIHDLPSGEACPTSDIIALRPKPWRSDQQSMLASQYTVYAFTIASLASPRLRLLGLLSSRTSRSGTRHSGQYWIKAWKQERRDGGVSCTNGWHRKSCTPNGKNSRAFLSC